MRVVRRHPAEDPIVAPPFFSTFPAVSRGRRAVEDWPPLCYPSPVKKGIKYWIFDLDNTLYAPMTGLFGAIDGRINKYIEEFCGVGGGGADALRREYFHRYGLTLLGLMKEKGADPLHYLDFVHHVPVAEYLKPDPELLAALEEIPVPKVVFTNGSRKHSENVLNELGISSAFEEVFDITSFGYIPKPDIRSYHSILDRLGIDGSEAVFAEDLAGNLAPARELGMVTILVGPEGDSDAADYTLGSLDELPVVISRIHD